MTAVIQNEEEAFLTTLHRCVAHRLINIVVVVALHCMRPSCRKIHMIHVLTSTCCVCACVCRGIRLLETELSGRSEGDSLPAAVAFKLYDTYGFPLDLTQVRDTQRVPCRIALCVC